LQIRSLIKESPNEYQIFVLEYYGTSANMGSDCNREIVQQRSAIQY